MTGNYQKIRQFTITDTRNLRTLFESNGAHSKPEEKQRRLDVDVNGLAGEIYCCRYNEIFKNLLCNTMATKKR